LGLKDENLLNPEELDVHLKNIKKSLHNNLFLIQNLVKWSRTQMDGFKPKYEPIALNKVVSDTISLLQATAMEKNIAINSKVNPDHICFADVEMVKLILRNTVSNGVKFSHANSSIEIASVKENNMIHITVKDNGVGMAQEEIDKLFTTTVQSAAGTENEKGTGIGLYITHEFVTLNKGKITMHSQKGIGSVLKVSLPEFSAR
jgi:signal transduction histidine kinase